MGSNAKTLTPAEVYEAINEAYKGNLKAAHYLGKGVKSEIAQVCQSTSNEVKKLRDQFNTEFPKVDTLVGQMKHYVKKSQQTWGEVVTL